MANQIKILIVEDNDDMFQAYEDTATDLNADERKFVLDRKISADQAKDALLSNHFDGAIVDLNLDQHNPGESAGNIVLREIIESHRFPVLIVSGNLGNLDEDIRQKESGFLKFFDREVPNVDIFNYLLKINKTGITHILGGRGQIDKRLGEIFWRHLACDFSNWDAGDRDSERTLLRYTVAHLAEYLDIPNGEDKFYHEAEYYIRPPIRKHISTGDIFERNGMRYILLSPACDVAVRNETGDGVAIINAERVVLAPLIKLNRAEFIEKKILKEAGETTKNREKILEEIIKGQRDKYAFLPGYGDIYPSVVDFQNIYTCTFDEYMSGQRIATVTATFLKDIQSRFSAYYGRQGQPDLDKSKLLREYKTRISPPT